MPSAGTSPHSAPSRSIASSSGSNSAFARAVLPAAYQALGPAARDFQAATHIRDLQFADVTEAQLEFAEEPVTAQSARPLPSPFTRYRRVLWILTARDLRVGPAIKPAPRS